MSTDNWLFGLAILGGIASLATILQFFGVKMPIKSSPSKSSPSKPTNDNFAKAKRLGLIGVGLALLSLALSSIGFFLSWNKGPETFVQLADIRPTDGIPVFRENKATKMNAYFVNYGPHIAYDVVAATEISVHATPLSDRMEDEVYETFLANALNDKLPKRDLTINEGAWGTFSTPVLNARDVDDLRDGRRRLYIAGFVKYRDRNGDQEVQFCQWLQSPGDSPVWHLCHGHNKIK